MSSPAANSRRSTSAAPRASGGGQQYDEYIQQQLRRARFQVKLVDLLAALMLLVGGGLTVLLVVVLVDHWVLELGPFARGVALLVLLAGAGYAVALRLVPLLVKRINPAFAARAIEQSEPGLKNSLINYLMFRGSPTPAGRLARRALKQQAALDLKHVDVNTVVDRSHVIHIGYAVVAIMVLFALYTIFSPKDVFQTVRRVAMPWADIARPARVRISDVQPGDETIVFGQTVTVAARVEGIDAEEAAWLVYSTKDQQVVDQQLKLERQEDGTWSGALPPGGDGIEQDISYRLQAGDAVTRTFRLNVVPAPTILVNRIDYQYPDYTGRPPRVDEKTADIDALEGTRVTIHGRASRPIQTAKVEFDPAPAERSAQRQSTSYGMQWDGQTATYDFTLRWDEESAEPQYAAYLLKFVDRDGRHSEQAVVHSITVRRDLPPEVEILTPQSDQAEVPVNGQQRIEIRALDPDFGLSRITLHAVAGGRELLQETLFDQPQGVEGQTVVDYDLAPQQLGLDAGAEVTFWAVAEDNRRQVAAGQEIPQPNSVRTRDYHLLVVPPDPASASDPPPEQPDRPADAAQQAPDQSPATPDQPSQQPTPDAQENAQGSPDAGQSSQPSSAPDPSSADKQDTPGQTGQQDASPADTAENQSGTPATADPNQDQPGEQAAAENQQDPAADPQSGQQSGQQSGEQAGQQSGEQSGEQSGQQGGQQGDQQGDQQSGADGQGAQQSPAGGGAGQPGLSGDQPQPAQGAQPGQPPQAGQAGGDSMSPGQPSPQPGVGGAAEPGPGGSAPPAGSSSRQEPLHDGEVIERALEYFQEQQKDGQPQSGQAGGPDEQSSSAEPDASQPSQPEAPSDQPESPGDADPSQPTPGSGQQPGTPPGMDSGQPGGDAADGGDQQQPPAGQAAPPAENGAGPGSGQPGSQQSESQAAGQTPQPTGAGADPAAPQAGPDQTSSSAAGPKPPEAADGRQPSAETASQETASQETAGAAGETSSGGETKDPSSSGGERGTPNEQASSSDASGDPGAERSAGGDSSDAAAQPAADSAAAEPTARQPDAGQGSAEESAAAPGASSEAGAPGPDGQDAPPQSPTARPDGQPTPAGQPPANGPPGEQGGAAGTQPGGGGSGEYGPLLDEDGTAVPDGEEANLEYAKKATDLVLRRLQDEQTARDPELLDRLGWTPAEMQAFVQRWQQLRQAAREREPGAEAELDDALRSLGLRAVKPRQLARPEQDDNVRGLRDGGGRSRPPAEYRDLFKAYRKGAARSPRP